MCGPPPHRLAVLTDELHAASLSGNVAGLATRSAPVKAGDQIMTVNGEALPHESFENARMALVFARQEAETLVVVFARSVAIPDPAAEGKEGEGKEGTPKINEDRKPSMTPKQRWKMALKKERLASAA